MSHILELTSLGAARQFHGGGAGFYNLYHHQLGEGFVGALWGPGGVSVPEDSLGSLSTREEEFQVGLGPGAAGQDLRRGWGTRLASKAPRIHASVPSLPGLASLCHQFAVGFCAKSISSLGLSFPSCHMGSVVLSRWSEVGTVEATQEWKTLSKP